MNRIYQYHIFCPPDDPSRREVLAAVDPAGFRGQSFNIELEEHDPKYRSLEDALHQLGLVPHLIGDPRDDRRHFTLHIIRQYDATDLQSAALLRLHPDRVAQPSEPRRAEDGILAVRPSRIRGKKNEIVEHYTYCPIIPDNVRALLQASDLRGLAFRETVVCIKYKIPKYKTKTWTEYGQAPWWELRSSVELPPVSPSMTIIKTPRGEPLSPGSTDFCGFREGYYVHPELHYLRSDVEQFPDFDLACTFERFAWSPHNRWLVASQRFCRFCLDNNIKCGWIPVRIDEG